MLLVGGTVAATVIAATTVVALWWWVSALSTPNPLGITASARPVGPLQTQTEPASKVPAARPRPPAAAAPRSDQAKPTVPMIAKAPTSAEVPPPEALQAQPYRNRGNGDGEMKRRIARGLADSAQRPEALGQADIPP